MKDDFERSCIRSYVDENKIRSLRSELSESDKMERQAEILAMLGDLTRLKILYSLSKADELCVCDLADVLDKEVSAISHQLRRLKDRGLVSNRRDGLTIYYRLSRNEEVGEIRRLVNTVLQPGEEIEIAL